MLIKTINPIYVNGAKESRPSEYLSFDASKASQRQILAFQQWHNKKGYTPKLVEDGVVTKGKNTEKAIAKYGSEFDNVVATMTGILTGGVSTGGNTSTAPSTAEQIEQAKQGKVWDKAKGWIKSDKAKDLLIKLQASGGVTGIWGNIKKLFGGGGGGGAVDTSVVTTTDTTTPTTDTTTPTTEKTLDGKPKWSTGKKIAVFGGGALVLGLIIYFVTRPKK